MSDTLVRPEPDSGNHPEWRFAVQPLLSSAEPSRLDRDRRRVLDRLMAGQSAQARAEVEQLEAVLELCALYQATDADEFCAMEAERFLRIAADGTPSVSEFLCCEVAAALGISQRAAVGRIVEALNLSHRHPVLHQAVRTGRMRVWQATRLMAEAGTASLSHAAALWVDQQWADHLGRLPLGRLVKLGQGLVTQADAELAAHRAEQARERRQATVVPDAAQTVAEVVATIDLVDGVVLNHTISALAQILAHHSDDSLDVRRAKALGILGTPGRAVLMLQSSRDYQDLVATGVDVDAEATPEYRRSAPLAQQPRTAVVVHCSLDSLESGTIGRMEGLGPVPLGQLRALLADSQVTIRPVIDHTAAPAVDRYEIPAATRAAVVNRTGHDAFPYSTIAADRCDLDHVEPYAQRPATDPTINPPPTRVDNLTPLSRRAHRAKTHGRWQYLLTPDGYHLWRSPLDQHYLTGPHGTTSHPSPVEMSLQLILHRHRDRQRRG